MSHDNSQTVKTILWIDKELFVYSLGYCSVVFAVFVGSWRGNAKGKC